MITARIGVLVMLLAAGAAFSQEVVDSVLAEVNGKVITRYDITLATRDGLAKLTEKYGEEVPREEVIKLYKRALLERIERTLLLQEAGRILDERSKRRITDNVDSLIKTLIARAGSLIAFQRKLQESGETVDLRKKRLQEERMIEQLLDEKVRVWISVSPAEMRRYYRQNRSRFEHPEMVKFRQILIKVGEYEDKAHARTAAENILRKIREGQDFATLARSRSHGPESARGGLWDFIGRGSLPEPVERVLFSLKAGEVSPVIETEKAFYILKAEEVRPQRTETFEEVQEKIGLALKDAKFRRALLEYLSKLRKNSQIRIYSPVEWKEK